MGGKQSSTRLSDEDARKKQLEKYGVLIPLSFGIGSSLNEIPSNILHRQPPTNPSMFAVFRQRSNSHRILTEYMTSSATIVSSNATVHGDGRTGVLAGCTFQDAKASYENALFQIQHSTPSRLLRLDAQSNGQVSLTGLYGLSPTTELFGSAKCAASRDAWFGGRTEYHLPTLRSMRKCEARRKSGHAQQMYYRNDPFQEEQNDGSDTFIGFGTWCDCSFAPLEDSPETSPFKAVSAYTSLVSPSYTILAEGRIPLGSPPSSVTDSPQVCYHAAYDMNALTGNGPALMLELNKTPTSSSIRINQVLSFDRQVANPIEVKAPQIRNMLGWTVGLKSVTNAKEKAEGAEDSVAGTSSSRYGPTNALELGLAWQLNRSVACKLVGTLTEQRSPDFRGAVIFKRWQQPTVTASLLFGFDHQRSTLTFRGIGFELGTGNGQPQYVYSRSGSEGLVSVEPPATKAVLPGEQVGRPRGAAERL